MALVARGTKIQGLATTERLNLKGWIQVPSMHPPHIFITQQVTV